MAGNSQEGTFHPWMTAKQASVKPPAPDQPSKHEDTEAPLLGFSAACWYFGEALTLNMMRMKEVVPLGLISTAIGGSMIEEWVPNSTTAGCKNVSIASHNELLYDSKVVPYLEMTMKGFLWYQGALTSEA